MEQYSSTRSRIVCIVGPTACHKTECAIELAKRMDGEIVSADSVQVYIGMDIGSAKPDLEERQGIRHHLIDCLPIDTPEFSVSQFRQMATAAIEEIVARGKTPIIIGGSGLYVNALTYPLGFAVPRNDEVRAHLSAQYDENPQDVFERLKAVDPESANRLHPNDKKRVVRALEVFGCTGKPITDFGDDFQNESGGDAPFDPLMIGLNMEREMLYARINLRVDHMMRRGLLEEARRIYDAHYDPHLPALRSIGYKQLFLFFNGEISLEEAIAQIKQDTRHFAKRQQTWFKRDLRIRWYDVANFDANKDRILLEQVKLAENWMKGIIKT